MPLVLKYPADKCDLVLLDLEDPKKCSKPDPQDFSERMLNVHNDQAIAILRRIDIIQIYSYQWKIIEQANISS